MSLPPVHFEYPFDEQSAGNGSLMRLAPVPLAFSRNPKAAMAMAADSSPTTHGARAAVDACRYMASLIVGALRGESKEVLLSDRYAPCSSLWEQAPLDPKIDVVPAGSSKPRDLPRIRGTGCVVQSLEAALWAFHRNDTFCDGCLAAVNLGDDADTTGAIYGQPAGAYYGEEAMPKRWQMPIALSDVTQHFADGLLGLADCFETG